MPRGIASSYFGRAGHLFVMSEFLLRGWNVAIPEVDQGDDIFVVKHRDGTFRRVQVKSAKARIVRKTSTAQFSISRSALFPEVSVLYFAFVVRQPGVWSHLFIIDSFELQQVLFYETPPGPGMVNLTLPISPERVVCRNQNFSPYLNQFRDFPIVEFTT